MLLDLIVCGGAFFIAYAIARRRGKAKRAAIISGVYVAIFAWLIYAVLMVLYIVMFSGGV